MVLLVFPAVVSSRHPVPCRERNPLRLRSLRPGSRPAGRGRRTFPELPGRGSVYDPPTGDKPLMHGRSLDLGLGAGGRPPLSYARQRRPWKGATDADGEGRGAQRVHVGRDCTRYDRREREEHQKFRVLVRGENFVLDLQGPVGPGSAQRSPHSAREKYGP